MFSESYKHQILLNLEEHQDLFYFESLDGVENIVASLFLSHNIPPNSKDVLLFIDEIQESPKAIKLLRYFYEKYPEIHVIAAGSLLEFAMGKVSSFPVGRIEYLYLHPFNFAEFLTAMGNSLAVKTIDNLPIESFSHQVLLDLYHTYALIGGMPGVVETYQRTKNAASLTRIYEGV